MERSEGIHACLGPSDPVGIVVNPGSLMRVEAVWPPEAMLGIFVSPKFMLGIWHGGNWLKRDLDQPIYGWVECGSPISSWFITFINDKFIPLILMCKCIDVYVDFDG